jgi:hypothetical protein
MPGPESNGNDNFWWSLDYGHVHFIAFSTEHPYTQGTPQWNWLIQVKRKKERKRERERERERIKE